MWKNNLTLILMVALFLASCRQDNKQDTHEEKDRAAFLEEQTSIQERRIYYRFPSPNEILEYIDREGLKFNDNLLLSADYSEKFLNSQAQAIGMGIYLTDLAYVTLFRKANEAVDYLEVIKYLSDELYIVPENESEIRSRVRNNLSNIDSLVSISKDSYNAMVDYLVDSGNETTLALISAGAYIEALNLVLSQVESFEQDDPFIKKILEQKLAYENLYRYFRNQLNDDPQFEQIHQKLTQVYDKMNDIKIVKSSETKLKEVNGQLVLTGGETTIEISNQQFQDIKTIIAQTRQDFAMQN
ncbi:MAG: hypothetical protein ACOC10_08120 [Bacteroidota bacterium]